RSRPLRWHVFLFSPFYVSFCRSFGSVRRLLLTVALLMSIHPALVLLMLFALPAVFVSSWRAGVERRTEAAAAPNARLARHLFDVGTMGGPAKEVRVDGTNDLIVHRRHEAWGAG